MRRPSGSYRPVAKRFQVTFCKFASILETIQTSPFIVQTAHRPSEKKSRAVSRIQALSGLLNGMVIESTTYALLSGERCPGTTIGAPSVDGPPLISEERSSTFPAPETSAFASDARSAPGSITTLKEVGAARAGNSSTIRPSALITFAPEGPPTTATRGAAAPPATGPPSIATIKGFDVFGRL